MAPEKGGRSMQQPIRYYITKSGEESTVRSVRVSCGSAPPNEASETDLSTDHDCSVAASERKQRKGGATVKDRLHGAIRKRGLTP